MPRKESSVSTMKPRVFPWETISDMLGSARLGEMCYFRTRRALSTNCGDSAILAKHFHHAKRFTTTRHVAYKMSQNKSTALVFLFASPVLRETADQLASCRDRTRASRLSCTSLRPRPCRCARARACAQGWVKQ